jgi:hypothetical protein
MTEALRQAIRDYGAWPLSQASGVSHPVIYRFVTGKRDLRWETVVRLCEALGLELRKVRKPKA